MKKIVLGLLTALLLASCGSDSSNNNQNSGNTVVNNPLQLSCINGQAYCNTQQYYGHPGFMPYPGYRNYAYDYSHAFITSGICGCPLNYVPTYNDQYGLGCVANNRIELYSATVSNWSYAYGYGFGFTVGYSNTYYYTSAPQRPGNYVQQSNIPNTGLHQSQCRGEITRSCFVNQANSCGQGSLCRPIANHGVLGICVKQ